MLIKTSNNYNNWIDVIKGRLELNNLDKTFFDGKLCIDIGCGTGRLSFCMANLGAKVWGIDPGQESIEFAKKLATEMKVKNVNFSIVTPLMDLLFGTCKLSVF